MLVEFAGNRELVLQANNAATLTKMIKWASTTASMVSAPASKPINIEPVADTSKDTLKQGIKTVSRWKLILLM